MTRPICTQVDEPIPEFLESNDIPNKWLKPVVTYCVIQGTKDVPKDHTYRMAVNLAMSTWETECRLVLKSVKSTEHPDITIKWVPGATDEYIGADSSILAWAGYPGTQFQGQLVLNDDKLWTTDGQSISAHLIDPIHYPDPLTTVRFKTYNMVQTIIHESGHLLGLTHSVNCPQCVMNPYYNGVIELQPNDIQRIITKYGKRNWRNDGYIRFKGWLYLRKRKFQ